MLNQEIYKLEEKYSDVSEKRNGTNIFYIRKGKKYASKERFEQKTKNEKTRESVPNIQPEFPLLVLICNSHPERLVS